MSRAPVKTTVEAEILDVISTFLICTSSLPFTVNAPTYCAVELEEYLIPRLAIVLQFPALIPAVAELRLKVIVGFEADPLKYPEPTRL